MTNTSALVLLILICGSIGLDYYFGFGIFIFLGQKFLALISWLAIWR